jgi:hypothetical protein
MQDALEPLGVRVIAPEEGTRDAPTTDSTSDALDSKTNE